MGITHAVISAVAAHYGVERDRLLSQDRSMPLVRHRQVAMAIARDMGCSLLAIAAELGRDHSTVLYGIRKVHALLDDGDVALARDIRAIIEKMCGERAA
jgi:chromosomal replication initiation ATPase DnaA